ncbi:MAG: hypothetical protein MUF47_08555, partial [Porphyrobacter sp.]|nr:hypothetical protein [Porphyrobacter sp.]
AVETAKIAAGAVQAEQIAAGAVVADKIAANAIDATKIAAGAVTATAILAGSVSTAALAAGAVTADQIAANAVTTAKINTGAVTANEIATNAVTAAKIAADAVTAGKVAAGAINAREIAAGAVTTEKLSVLSREYVNPVSVTGNLNGWGGVADDGTGSGDGLSYNAAERAIQLAGTLNHSVRSRTFRVDHNKIYRVAARVRKNIAGGTYWIGIQATTNDTEGLTEAENGRIFDSLAVQQFNTSRGTATNTSNSYFAGAIAATTAFEDHVYYIIGANRNIADCPAHVGPGLTPFVQLPDSAAFVALRFLNWDNSGTARNLLVRDVSVTEIGTGQIVADNIAANAITGDKITANAIGANQIAANAVTAAKIAAGAVTAGKVAANAITAAEIASGAITSVKIAANAVTADKISVNDLSAISANLGTIQVGSANIANLSVGTIKIANRAVSVWRGNEGSGSASITTNIWTTICSLTFTPGDNDSSLIAQFIGSIDVVAPSGSAVTYQVRVQWRGVNVAVSQGFTAASGGSLITQVALLALPTAGTGSGTLTVQVARTSGSGGSATLNGNLVCGDFRK